MKYIIASILSFVAGSALAASTSVVVQPGTFTNLLSLGSSGYARVTALSVTANSTNVTVAFIDTPTNVLTYVSPAYTNLVSYATNYIQSWTNYYGATNSWTNMTLVDVANTVAATTNNYPTRVAVGALAGTSTIINPANYKFEDGIWVTNNSTGIATITATYVQ